MPKTPITEGCFWECQRHSTQKKTCWKTNSTSWLYKKSRSGYDDLSETENVSEMTAADISLSLAVYRELRSGSHLVILIGCLVYWSVRLKLVGQPYAFVLPIFLWMYFWTALAFAECMNHIFASCLFWYISNCSLCAVKGVGGISPLEIFCHWLAMMYGIESWLPGNFFRTSTPLVVLRFSFRSVHNRRGAEPHPFIPRIICNQAKTL